MPTRSSGRHASFAGFGSNGGLARRRLRDRDELLAGRDEVDLLVVDAVLVGDGDRHEEDAEDVLAVRDDPRPRLVVGVVPRVSVRSALA